MAVTFSLCRPKPGASLSVNMSACVPHNCRWPCRDCALAGSTLRHSHFDHPFDPGSPVPERVHSRWSTAATAPTAVGALCVARCERAGDVAATRFALLARPHPLARAKSISAREPPGVRPTSAAPSRPRGRGFGDASACVALLVLGAVAP